MGFGSFFKKDKKEETVISKEVNINSPINGEYIKLENVDDPAFSQKMLGEGFAVRPQKNQVVVAPVSGEITSLFETGHAFGITTKEGIELLVHIGVDTVSLNGHGFTTLKKQGEKVNAGDEIVKIDVDYIKNNAPSSDVIVIVTNMDIVSDLSINENESVDVNDLVATVKLK